MLSIQAAESSYITAKELDEKGIALVAKPGSLLATLVASTYINHEPAIQDGEFHFDMAGMCTLTDQPDSVSGYSEHTACMEEMSDFLAEQITKHLFYARTVVAPFVDEFASQLSQASTLISGNPDNGVEIVVHSQPGPLAEPSLVESIMRNKDAPFIAEPLNASLPAMDDNQIRALMATGSASVDAAISEFFATKEEGWLAARWNSIFCIDVNEPTPGNGLDAYIHGRDNVDTALMVFLIARRLWNAPPDGTNMTAAAYESMMINYRTQAGLRLCHELDRLERDDKAGILIIGSESGVAGTGKIKVNSVVYRKFLKDGGTNEMLLGNLLQPQREVLASVILQKKEILEATWARNLSQNKALYDHRRFLQFSNLIVAEWTHLTMKYSPEDFPIQDRATALAIVKAEVRKLTAKSFDDLPALALSLACKARFYKTDAYDILAGMQRAREVNPGIDAREAANISITEYVCRWIGKTLEPVVASRLEVFTSKDTVPG